MITAKFITKNQRLTTVEVSGHAMYDDYGKDIVCAGVTSSLMMFANGVTEILGEPARIKTDENKIVVELYDDSSNAAFQFLESFWLHMNNLKDSYPENIKIITSEV